MHEWSPLTVGEVASLLQPLHTPWWIAGGYAIELFVGRPIREHGDIDVVVLRRDQDRLREVLSDWDCWVAHRDELLERGAGEWLDRPHSDLWCREHADSPWRLQVMLLDAEGDNWVFKRNAAIGGALSELGLRSDDGVPYLRPEVQLLYKAKLGTLEKDQRDFDAAWGMMDEVARQWLRERLRIQFPGGHQWLVIEE